jgi:hypothetical protein
VLREPRDERVAAVDADLLHPQPLERRRPPSVVDRRAMIVVVEM